MALDHRYQWEETPDQDVLILHTTWPSRSVDIESNKFTDFCPSPDPALGCNDVSTDTGCRFKIRVQKGRLFPWEPIKNSVIAYFQTKMSDLQEVPPQ
jgi:hypothetical protein